MTTNIGYCGYSYHTQPFYSHYRTGFPASKAIKVTERIGEIENDHS
jgi:hypothetical protein